MHLSWFSQLEAWPVSLALVLAMPVAVSVGYRIGHRLREQTGDTGRGHFGAVQGSLLGLLALLLGFSFSMSTARYEVRRALVMEDANALTGLYLDSSLLPEPQRGQFRELLGQYVGVRTDPRLVQGRITVEALAAGLARAEELHRRMWELARDMLRASPTVPGAEGLLSALKDALSVHRRRVYAYESRVPGVIIALLFGAAVTSAGAVGYSGGLGRYHGWPASILLTVLVSGTIYVILDLDRPQSGLIRVDQTPLLQARAMLDWERGPEP
ncbi:MAG: hypothetical protein BWZ02_00272 [Lentisphaerae bacterium ADurb.BinA184]|nr:MAG: hypothetical protein BWZ02_00272 [Lentisphaerae bacterium ADurb.BinA184]